MSPPPATEIRRIALSTGGGDAPGLNAVIRAATLAAHDRGWEVVGIRDGFNGLLFPEEYPDGGVLELSRDRVRSIVHQGGTILGTTNRGNPTRFPVVQADGSVVEIDRTEELLTRFAERAIDALISIGGDGSLGIAHHLQRHGLRVIGVPKTIDNDLEATVSTFGFDSAVSFATECIDRLFTTATSHGRVIVVEVMGRYAGWIALHAGIASGAHAILIPEVPFDLDPVASTIAHRHQNGSKFSIVVVAEGATPMGGGHTTIEAAAAGHAERLGGIGHKVAEELERLTGKEARTVVLGHLLRGGSPTSFDRILAMRFGAAAVRALADGADGVMVCLANDRVDHVPLAQVSGRQKKVPLESDTVRTAREMGISFGDHVPGTAANGWPDPS